MQKGTICEIAKSLEDNLVRIGDIEESREILGKPFPLVLEPRESKMNFVQL